MTRSILGHRLSEWTGRAPLLEEELALANIGLDLIGQARALYALAASRESGENDEDRYAYLRDAGQYRNLLLVEQPNGDFAQTIVRQFYYSAFADPYWRAMMRSTDHDLAAIAAKSEKESAYHLRHAAEWLIRLGDGTEESHRRAQEAIDLLWPYTGEMFEVDAAENALIAAGRRGGSGDAARCLGGDARSRARRGDAGASVRHLDATRRTFGAAFGTSRPSAGGAAASAAHLSGSALVSAAAERRARAWAAAAAVTDPELPVLTIADLGVLRDVSVAADGHIEVAITPTYSGCPAMAMIALEVETALARAGVEQARVRTVLSPAWTTDWMSRKAAASCANTGSPRHRRRLDGARCSAGASSPVRVAARPTPSVWRNSARPPASRSGAAAPAASRSTISNVTSLRSLGLGSPRG